MKGNKNVGAQLMVSDLRLETEGEFSVVIAQLMPNFQ